MGLDMYLLKKTYVKDWNHTPKEQKYNINIERGDGTNIKPERITEIVEEVAYWRKANAIHKWFVDNVQDGNDDRCSYTVSSTELSMLRDVCIEVLATKNVDLLPTQDGFFFGSTDYDDHYHDDLEYTVSVLNDLLRENEFDTTESRIFIYESSW